MLDRPEAVSAFANWTARYLTGDASATVAQGVALAWKRREAMRELMESDPETALKLAEGMGMSSEDAEWYGAPHIMDQAAATLAAEGYVKLTDLQEKLSDDEPAYSIELLEEGRAMIRAGKRPVFRDLDL